jgi:hypothetical protein
MNKASLIPRITEEQRAFILKNRDRGPLWIADQLNPITYDQVRVVLRKERRAKR